MVPASWLPLVHWMPNLSAEFWSIVHLLGFFDGVLITLDLLPKL